MGQGGDFSEVRPYMGQGGGFASNFASAAPVRSQSACGDYEEARGCLVMSHVWLGEE
jgi:hypothetical protein